MGALLAIIAGSFTVVGNAFAKQWASRGELAFFIAALLFFTASSMTYPFALKHGSLMTLTAVVNVFALLATTVIGLLFFRERVTGLQALGIVFAFAAIVMLTYPQRA